MRDDLIKHESKIIMQMVTESGESVGAPKPYLLKAVYADRNDPSVKFAVFADANGVQHQTGMFKMIKRKP